MTGRLVVVSGTGTGIGKTHLAVALTLAWTSVLRDAGVQCQVLGLKPVESGVTKGELGDDAKRLEQASTFHVKRPPPPYLLGRAVSPHLAAREEGRVVEAGPIEAYVTAARAEADAVVVELAGGLFSPLAPGLSNAEVARRLDPDAHVLVAPDRLGVLHDVAAATLAAQALGGGAVPTAIVLVTPRPGSSDASTGSNAAELPVVTAIPVRAVLPWAPSELLALGPELRSLLPR